jgi:formate hydrogenlyase subunit 6/NADH:ubiquinone oxidoreductase subunit I
MGGGWPYGLLEVRPLTAADKRLLSLGDRFRAWVHHNRQAFVVEADVRIDCVRCGVACPVPQRQNPMRASNHDS